MKYLEIKEYSSIVKNKIPEIKDKEHELILKESVIHSKIVDKDDNDMTTSLYSDMSDSIKIDDMSIPLNQVYIYDDLYIGDESQNIAYVYECPICYHTIISTEPNLETCPHCGNNRFPLDVKGLINTSQMEEIAFDNSDVSTYIYIDKDDNIKVFMPNED